MPGTVMDLEGITGIRFVTLRKSCFFRTIKLSGQLMPLLML